ncbi:MAG: hypothetical protein M0026_10015 [Nocardiopsaceae bacterium]|nr:hypothetical protein [Nocardiopsaceae bacterium]
MGETPSTSPTPSPSRVAQEPKNPSASVSKPAAGPSAAAKAPVARFGYDPLALPAGSGTVGTVAMWTLVLLLAAVLVLRLSAGWPRFPPRYRGKRGATD